jgi:hypothetical protein
MASAFWWKQLILSTGRNKKWNTEQKTCVRKNYQVKDHRCCSANYRPAPAWLIHRNEFWGKMLV